MSLCPPPLILTVCLVLNPLAFAAPIDFTRDIVPLFDQHCVDCHAAGDDADGEFALDSFAALMKGGKNGKALYPGKAEESLLVKFLEGRSGKTGKNQFMPPGKKEHLKPEQIAMIRQWIDEGAHGPSATNAAPTDPFAKLPKIASTTTTKPIRSVAVSADGKVLAIGRYGSVELIGNDDRKSLRKLAGIAGNPNAMAFSSDGTSLFIAAGNAGLSGIAYRFSVGDGKLITTYQGHSDALYALAVSPDGKVVATGGYDQKIKLWDIATGKEAKLLKGHNGSVNGLSFRPDGKLLASASADRTIKLWDVANGSRLDTLSQPTKEQYTVAFSHDGRSLVAGGADNRIRLWSVSAKATEGSTPLVDTKFAHEGSVLSLAFSPDGKSLLSASSDRSVKLWSSADISELHAFDKQSDWASAVAWAGNGKFIAARQDGSAAMYDISTGKADRLAWMEEGHRQRKSGEPQVWLDEKHSKVLNKALVLVSRAALHGNSEALKGRNNVAQGKRAPASATLGHRQWKTGEPQATLGGQHNRALASAQSPGAGLAGSGASASTGPGMVLGSRASLADRPRVTLAGARIPWARLSRSFRAHETGDSEALGYRSSGANNVLRCQAAKPKAKAKTTAPANPNAKPKGMAKAAPMAPAKPSVPVLTRLNPPGFQAGGKTVIQVIGTGLDKVTAAKASDPRIAFKITPIKPTELWLEVTAPAELPRAAYDLSLISPAGESAKLKLYADHLPHLDIHSIPLEIPSTDRPSNVFGTLTAIGQRDDIIIAAHPGQTITLDLAAKAIGSKLTSPRLELFDNNSPRKRIAASSGLDSGSDPFIAYTVPAGDKLQYFHVMVSETTLEGSADHVYRLNVGALPIVVGWWPLSVKANAESEIHLVGFNLKKANTKVKSGASGEVVLPLDTSDYRSRVAMKVQVSDMNEVLEKQAQLVAAPASINGTLFDAKSPDEADADDYTFTANKDETFVIETQAAMLGSPADTKLEILDAQLKPVPRLLLQAVRDSWINFRSIDANNPDARVENWREMDLNQYIYFQGDIARIFRLPRGPDSGFLFFGFGGKRRAYFDTTATAHALDEPCYVVEPKPLGSKLPATGLPVFTLNYANDDASDRRSGSDSRVFFTAPTAGKYTVRVTDSRGWSGERFAYRLTLRHPEPDFAITLDGDKPSLGAGASIGFSVKATRKDGFEGPITVKLDGIPAGFYASSPLVIEAGAEIANGSLFASPTAVKTADWSKVKLSASATVNDKSVAHQSDAFKSVTLIEKPKIIAVLEPDVKGKAAMRAIAENTAPLEVTIAPGETKSVWLRAERSGNDALLNFDIHNLPFGIIIDNIGLSGVAVRAGESEREVFLTAAKWVPEQDRLCHAAIISARNEQDSSGVQTSYPILLKVRKAAGVAAK